MSSIHRAKSAELVLITLFNLDGLETQSMKSFRVENTSTVFDLINHLQSRYPNSSDIELYFEEGQKFEAHKNTYLINIIRAKQDRVVKYRVIENNMVSLNKTNYPTGTRFQIGLPIRPESAIISDGKNFNYSHSKFKILNQGQINQNISAIQQQFQESEPERKQIQDKETSYHQRISELECKNSSLQIYLDEEKQKNIQLKQTINQLEQNYVELKVKQQLELQQLSQQMKQSINNNEQQRLQRENQSLIGQQQDLSQRIESFQKENKDLILQLQQITYSYQQLKYENEQLKQQFKVKDQNQQQTEILQKENQELKQLLQSQQSRQNQPDKSQLNNQQSNYQTPTKNSSLSESQYPSSSGKIEESQIAIRLNCFHQFQRRELEEMINTAISSNKYAKCKTCSQNIKQHICRQLGYAGKSYLDMKLKLDLQEILRQLKYQNNLAKCSNQNCSFFCLWKIGSSQYYQDGFCPNCLVYQVKMPLIQSSIGVSDQVTTSQYNQNKSNIVTYIPSYNYMYQQRRH